MAGEGDTRLLNPDGYTRWWNPTEFPHTDTMFGYKDGLLGTPDSVADFNSTINAYKLFCDDITEPDAPLSDVDPSSRCVFTSGSQNVRHYTIDMGDGLVFNYAVDANWMMPEGTPPWEVPDDFPHSANRPEAWNATINETSNTLWNDGINSGGSLSLEIALWDHFDAGLNTIYVESPGNFDPVGPINPTIVSSYMATYEVDITSATPAQGSIDILISAESEKVDYQGILPGEPIAAYFVRTAYVSLNPDNLPPVAVAEIVSEPPFSAGDAITFDASASYDPDGTIVSTEWDFNSDGIYGDSYDSGTDSIPTKIFNDPGTYYVNVRVTDDDGASDTLEDPLIVIIGAGGDIIWVDDDAVEPYLGTFEQPFPTIEMGIEAADATYPEFSHIMVKDGTYPEEVFFEKGNVLLEGYSTPAPIIQSPDDSLKDLVILGSSATNTTIKHFQLKPMADTRGVYASGSNQVIDDIELLDNPGGPTCSWGVYVGSWSGTGNIINNVRVDGYHKKGSGFISASGEDIKVTNCVLLNITYDGPSPFHVIYVNGNTTSEPHPDLLIAKNVVGHITHASTIDDTEWCRAVTCSYVSGATIRNNLVFDIVNKHTGGWTWGMDLDDAKDVILEHNTVTRITGPKWIYALEVGDWNTDPSGVIHRNHIVTDLTTTGTMNWRWAYLGMWDGTPLPVDYSCAYNVGHAFYDGIDDVVEGVGFIYQNPQFMDPNNDDFRVTAGSPASGAAHDGTDMGAYGGPDPLTWLPD
jgi:hypothetical protein